MKMIDFEGWDRKQHYDLYKNVTFPHFGVTVPVDITVLRNFCKRENLSIFKVLMYLSLRTVNRIQNFRTRIRQEGVVEHGIVHPRFTTLLKNDLYSYCEAEYTEDPFQFIKNCDEALAELNDRPLLFPSPERDDVVSVTSLPWMSYTAIQHPIQTNPVNSLPWICWGKHYPAGDKILLPLSFQCHHGLADGVHIGRFYELIQTDLDTVEAVFNGYRTL